MFKNSELMKVFLFMKKRIPAYLIVTILLALVQGIFLNIVLAYIMKDAINAAMNNNLYFLNRSIIIAILSLLIGVIFSPLFGYIRLTYVKKTMKDIRIKTFKHLERLTIRGIEKQHTGDITSRMTNDVDTIEDIYASKIPMLIFTILYGLISVGAIFKLDWRFGVLVIFFGLVSILINKIFTHPLRKSTDEIQKNKAKVTNKLINILEGIQTIKIFNIGHILFQQYKNQNHNLVSSKNKLAKLDSTLMLINTVYDYLRLLGLLIIGLIMVMHNQLDVGTIAAIILLESNASFFFVNIGSFISGTKSALAGSSRVFEFLNQPIEQDKGKSNLDIINHDEMVKLRGVVFRYEENNVIDKLNLTAYKGKVTALVGPSGGGKSTIFKLLLRFYQKNSGDVWMNGNNINDYHLKNLRNLMAYVPQDAYLFSGSILDNIRYGKPDASVDEVVEVAKKAFAHDFIMEQANGYDTPVGEKGAKLSGGQRQRIAIARALLKNAPLLLLDEATSALDSEAESIVQKALTVLMKNRTTLVIAHRLKTIEHADYIYVISDGKVQEEGKHQDLIEQNGLYKRLYKIQFES